MNYIRNSNLFLIIIVLLLLFKSSSVTATAPVDDANLQSIDEQKQILISMVSDLIGNTTTTTTNHHQLPYCLLNWNNSTDSPCDFTGVFCNPERTQVTEIHLTTDDKAGGLGAPVVYCPSEVNGITYPPFRGTLPEQLANISSLKVLDFTGNSAMSIILHKSWGRRMKKIEKILLMNCGNRFGSSLPSEWAEVDESDGLGMRTNLHVLNIVNSKLVGGLPANYSKFSNLYYLNLGLNFLSGPIPSEWGFGLKKLWYLGLLINRLSGEIPLSFENLSNLNYATFASNSLSGNIPAWNFTKMSALRYFLAAVNKISGSFPESWSESKLKQIVFSSNKLSGELPVFLSRVTTLEELDLSRNQFSSDSLPEEFANFSQLIALDLSDNNIKGSFLPKSWAQSMKNVVLIDLSGNCISIQKPDKQTSTSTTEDDDNDIISEFAKLEYLTTLDLTPSCTSVLPFNTSTQLAGPNIFRRSNPSGLELTCKKCATTSVAAGLFPANIERSWELILFCTADTRITYSNTLDFGDSCVSGYFTPTLLCYEDADLLYPCSSSSSFTYPVPLPSWQNITQQIPYLASGAHEFLGARDAQYLFSAYYILKFDIALNWINGTTIKTLAQSNVFQGPRCDQNTSIAIPYTTSCAPCPQYARCFGTSDIKLEKIPAWRPRDDVLPLQECLKQYSAGCQDQSDDNNDESDESDNVNDFASVPRKQASVIIDGTGCKKGYRSDSPFCSACAEGFGKIASSNVCTECPSRHAQIILFAVGLIVLLVVITVFVYISIAPKKKNKNTKKEKNGKTIVKNESSLSSSSVSDMYSEAGGDDEDDNVNNNDVVDADDESRLSSIKQKCRESCVQPVITLLERFRPQLEKILIALRQLVNHFSLIGALIRSTAAQQLALSVQSLLQMQQSSTTFAFGSYASTISCMFPNVSSSSILIFDLIWAVFGCVFVVESLIFFGWFRKTTTTAAVALFLSFLSYASLTENSTMLLALCKRFHFYDTRSYLISPTTATPVKSFHLLTTDIEQNCDDPGFHKYRIAAALTLVFFSVGLQRLLLPLFIVFVHYKMTWKKVGHEQQKNNDTEETLLSHNETIINNESKNQSSCQHQTGTHNNSNNHSNSSSSSSSWKKRSAQAQKTRDEILSFLTEHYKEEVWYWEVIVMLRKTVVACIFSIFTGFVDFQLELYTAMCMILLVLSFNLQPLINNTANAVDQLSISSAAVCAVLLSLTNSFPDDDGVSVFTAVGIFLTQIVAIGAVFLVAIFGVWYESRSKKEKGADDSANTACSLLRDDQSMNSPKDVNSSVFTEEEQRGSNLLLQEEMKPSTMNLHSSSKNDHQMESKKVQELQKLLSEKEKKIADLEKKLRQEESEEATTTAENNDKRHET